MSRGKVGVLTTYHVHNDGERIIYGGAERYGVEFTKMLTEMGFDVAWWQIGSGWTAEVIPGVPLYTIPAGDVSYQTCPLLNHAFHEQAEGIQYAVYFSTLLAYPRALERSISISHGIYWDYPTWEQMVPPRSIAANGAAAGKRLWRGCSEWFRAILQPSGLSRAPGRASPPNWSTSPTLWISVSFSLPRRGAKKPASRPHSLSPPADFRAGDQ